MRRALVLTFLLAALPVSAVWAHRIIVGVGSQTVLTIHRTEIVVAFNLEYAGIAAFQEMKKFDKDRDGNLSKEERTALVEYVGDRVGKETSLFFEGKEIQPSEVVLEDDRSLLIGPLDVLPFDTWWRFTYPIPRLVPDETYSVVLLDNTYEGEVAQQLFWLRFEDQKVDNYMIVDPGEEQIDLVRDSLQITNHRKVEIQIGVIDEGPDAVETDEDTGGGTGPGAFGADPKETAPGSGDPFRPETQKQEEQLETEKMSGNFDRAMKGAWGMVIALLLSAFWGAVHALGPGHGKSMVAAYLVGSKGRVRDAMVLGGTATFAHTFSIFIIGGALIWVFYETMARSQAVIQTWVGAGSGALVASIGLLMLRQRIRALRKPELDHHHHHHHGHHHDHSHDHGDADHDHGEAAAAGTDKMHLTSLISLGFSGGIVPCPSGLALIIIAFTRKQPVLGLTLLTAFSLGLGLVLVTIGVVLVLGKATISRRFSSKRWGWVLRTLPIASAILISIVGGAIAYGAYLEGVSKGIF